MEQKRKQQSYHFLVPPLLQCAGGLLGMPCWTKLTLWKCAERISTNGCVSQVIIY